MGRAHEGGSFVTGDAVNVAARLEQAAESGEILVGDRTATIVEGAFEFGELRVVEAKGKPLGVACRALHREIALSRPRGVRGLGSGVRRARTGGASACATLFDDVAAGGRPHLVTIVGEAGAGKTRLATELWDLVGSIRPAPVRLSGRCLPYGRGITYWPLGEMLKQHYGVRESDRPDALLAQLGGRAILGLSVGLPVAGDLSPRARARPAAPGMGRLRRGAREPGPGAAAGGGPALGRGGAPGPARADHQLGPRPAARAGHRTAGAAGRPAGLGRGAPGGHDRRARAALGLRMLRGW